MSLWFLAAKPVLQVEVLSCRSVVMSDDTEGENGVPMAFTTALGNALTAAHFETAQVLLDAGAGTGRHGQVPAPAVCWQLLGKATAMSRQRSRPRLLAAVVPRSS